MRRVLLLLLVGLLAAPAFATISLTTAVPIPNIQRWNVANVQIDDENARMLCDVELRTGSGTNQVVARARIGISNSATGGPSTKLGIVSPLNGGSVTDVLSYGSISLATGYTDALAAWRGGATAAARKNALEAYLLSSGIVDSTFSGV